MTPAELDARDDLHARALASFLPGTGAYRIANALLNGGAWMTRGQLAVIGDVAGTRVAYVVMKLRSLGVDVQHIRTTDRGEAMYLVAPQLPAAA